MVALELQGTGPRIRPRDLMILRLHTWALVTDVPATTGILSFSLVESLLKLQEMLKYICLALSFMLLQKSVMQ